MPVPQSECARHEPARVRSVGLLREGRERRWSWVLTRCVSPSWPGKTQRLHWLRTRCFLLCLSSKSRNAGVSAPRSATSPHEPTFWRRGRKSVPESTAFGRAPRRASERSGVYGRSLGRRFSSDLLSGICGSNRSPDDATSGLSAILRAFLPPRLYAAIRVSISWPLPWPIRRLWL